eukprot:1158582-Pelagomonas_calceolata.AAC.5
MAYSNIWWRGYIVPWHWKEKEKPTSARRPRAFRKGSLTSKLAKPRRKPETELLGIWRVARHAPGRPDSPSPALHRHAPRNPPFRSPLEMKCMSGVDDSR